MKELCKHDVAVEATIPGESEASKYPPRYVIRAKNTFLGRVIPNEEVVSRSGLVLPNVSLCQEAPTACYIVKLGEVDADKYPWATEGRLCRYPFMAGQIIDWPWSQETFIYLHCDAVYAYAGDAHDE